MQLTVASLISVLNQLLPEPHAGLLAGILFGTKATLSKDLYDALVTTGTLHIVALSGMNITILTSLVNLGLLRIFSRRIASLLTIVLIAYFVWFVGFSPSVVRAAIMGSIGLLAVIFGRQNWALLTWLLAVGLMLLLNFQWLFDLSFQLSALATLGIILFGRSGAAEVGMLVSASKNVLPPRLLVLGWGFLWNLAADDLRLTLSAQVFTIPLILWHFHRISLISPLTNVLIGWTLAPLTVGGWAVAALGWVFLPLGQPVAWLAWVLLEYMVTVVKLASKVPGASIGW